MVIFLQDDIVLGKKLGGGAFGVVYRATLLSKNSSSKVCSFGSSSCSLSI